MLILLLVISFKFVNNQYRWPPQSGQLLSWEAYSPHEELSSITNRNEFSLSITTFNEMA